MRNAICKYKPLKKGIHGKNKQLQELINNSLREKLETFGCLTGRFECNVGDISFLISMYGIKENGKSILFMEWDNSFKKNIRTFLESSLPELATCIIEIDLESNAFAYKTLNELEYKAKLLEEKKQHELKELQQQEELKKRLASQTTQYGKELATRVAEKLTISNYLYHQHRDYCGMGLGVNEEGKYIYGPVYDG